MNNRRPIEEQLDAANAELKQIHGDVWPATWKAFFLSWRDRLSLPKQSQQVARLFGVTASASTIRNIQRRLDEDD